MLLFGKMLSVCLCNSVWLFSDAATPEAPEDKPQYILYWLVYYSIVQCYTMDIFPGDAASSLSGR